jgi:hypothetical protein
VFGILIGVAVVVFVLSFSLVADRGNPDVNVDAVAAVLIGGAIMLLTLGFNNLNGWGLLTATADAPFDIAGASPALIFIVVGIVLGQAFFLWTRRRSTGGRLPLVDLSVLGSARERAAVYARFVIVALEASVNFTIPLYVQIVQGRSPFSTSLAMMPFNLTVFVAAVVVVRFYRRFTPRAIGVTSFTLVTAALLWLSVVLTNDWETVPTIAGLVVFRVGQGALVTLVFNVLVTASPRELAGDVGSVRGTTQNLASAVGTALAGALLVTVLGIRVTDAVARNVELPDRLVAQVDLDNINFVANDRLRDVLSQTDATDAQIDEAIAINTDARLDTLRLGLLILAAVSAVAILPASRLPDYLPREIPDPREPVAPPPPPPAAAAGGLRSIS